MSVEIRVDVYPVLESERFIYRYVSKLVNEGLKKYGAEWFVNKRIVSAPQRIIDGSTIDEIFDDLYHEAWMITSAWKAKLDNISGILFFTLYIILSLFFVAAYVQTRGIVAFGVLVLAVTLLFVPWWYSLFNQLMIPVLEEKFPL